jgi:hypothetical protein
MNSIFLDNWALRDVDGRGEWKHCNFYSVTALNKSESHPFHGVPVGFPCISKGAEFLLRHGVREALSRKRVSRLNDVMDASSNASPELFTISPIPSLAKAIARSPDKEILMESARKHIAERRDPVAKFHIGNGASLFRINWNADDSERRQAESFGMMANYDYNAVAKKK